MWLDYTIEYKKIKSMFNDELSLDNSVFDSFSLSEPSSLQLHFYIKKIPHKIPSKWKNQEFNELSLVLTLIGIKNLTVRGNRLNFICSPVIEKKNDEFIVTIKHSNKFLFSCSTELISISSIEPILNSYCE